MTPELEVVLASLGPTRTSYLLPLESPPGMFIWFAREAFRKVKWLAKDGALVTTDGILALWLEILSSWGGGPLRTEEVRVYSGGTSVLSSFAGLGGLQSGRTPVATPVGEFRSGRGSVTENQCVGE